MTALPDYRHELAGDLADKVIARLPDSAFGNTEWVTMTSRAGAEHLRAAIASNRPHRVANAIRSMAFAPNLDTVETLALAVCDAIVLDAYAARDTATIANVTNARSVVADAVADLRSKVVPTSAELSQLRETVDGYVRLVGVHDARISERLEAVGFLSGRLARSLKLSEASVLNADFAGRLHDIGMIELSRSRRNKAIALSKKEHDRFKHHPIAGETFVAAIPSLAHLAPIVRAHHERFDGHGFPDGLAGDEIPFVARIISVAATFVDLVTGSSHIEAMLPHAACCELAARAGTEFDPTIVAATLRLLYLRGRRNRSA